MDPKEFNNLASELVAGNTPAKIRTAISRAYYAAFLIGAELLDKELGFQVPKSAKGHNRVKVYLNNSGDKEFMEVSSKLGTLQNNRIRADYRPDKTKVENLKNAQSLVEQAESIIRTMRADIDKHRRSQIIAAIRNYRALLPDD